MIENVEQFHRDKVFSQAREEVSRALNEQRSLLPESQVPGLGEEKNEDHLEEQRAALCTQIREQLDEEVTPAYLAVVTAELFRRLRKGQYAWEESGQAIEEIGEMEASGIWKKLPDEVRQQVIALINPEFLKLAYKRIRDDYSAIDKYEDMMPRESLNMFSGLHVSGKWDELSVEQQQEFRALATAPKLREMHMKSLVRDLKKMETNEYAAGWVLERLAVLINAGVWQLQPDAERQYIERMITPDALEKYGKNTYRFMKHDATQDTSHIGSYSSTRKDLAAFHILEPYFKKLATEAAPKRARGSEQQKVIPPVPLVKNF